jgi:hypothetical protein
MDAPVFTAVASGSRLYASSAMPAGGFAGYWCSASAAFGGTASLAQTWADVGGLYVIALALPADLTAFAQQLTQLIARISPTGLVRVLWLSNSVDSSWNYWQATTLTALPQATPSGPWALVTPARWVLGDYRLELAAGSTLSLQNAGTGYGLALPAAAATFSRGDFALSANGAVMLPLAGNMVGALSMPITLRPQQPDPLEQLGVMLRYATVPAPDDAEALAQNLARYLSMPVLRLRAGSLGMRLHVDPSAPFDPRRSYVDLAPSGAPPYALSSAFVTTLGYATTLTPTASLQGARSARLAFCKSPLFAVEGPNTGSEAFHLAPDGSFSISVEVPPSVQQRRAAVVPRNGSAEQDHWMFGDSGAEYATLAASTGDIAVFGAGKPAYIPGVVAEGTLPLRTAATTAYMTLVPGSTTASGLPYYAQPLQAPLFMAASALGAGFLDFHTMPAGRLPAASQAGDLAAQCFPAGAYRWLAAGDIALAREIEAAVLAPVRRAAIGGLPPPTTADAPIGPVGPATAPLAVTPQGLLAQLSADGSAWAGVLFAHLAGGAQDLMLTPVKERFALALQSNQLFFVVADTTEFNQQSGVGPNGLDCQLDGWTFRLAPDDWRRGKDANPTLMLFKYCNRRLTELADDTSAWGWPEAAGNVAQTQQQLQDILRVARERALDPATPPGDPYRIFYDDVADNPMWNGVLFLNAPVALGLMPPDLKFLAAGIDPKRFYAHHVGFSVTPVVPGTDTITPGQTAAFALIDYEDPQDLAPSSTTPFGFKTLQLKIRFANARIADFAAQCQLMVNTLFGAPLAKQDPTRGNNLIMNGSCQRVAGVPSYSFVLTGENLFNAQGSAMVSAQVQAVRIDTATAPDGDAVTSSFTLQGNLRFRELAAFDMFCYGADAQGEDGYLRFTGMSIRMQFKLSEPTKQAFTAFESATTLDPANSKPRARSLAANFPLRASGIEIAPVVTDGKGLTPEQLGFVSIACPLDQTPMSAPWYGLRYTMDLGSLGALSGSIGLSMSVLAAWSAGADGDPPVYLGLRLASFVRGAGSLPLQGVLKLGFRGFEFITYPAGEGLGYQLWMRRFALSVLCWSFPPGNADLVLFGAPGNPSGSLGWYAAYDKDPEKKAIKADETVLRLDAPARLLANGRRTPPVA